MNNNTIESKNSYKILTQISARQNVAVFKAECLPLQSKVAAIKVINGDFPARHNWSLAHPNLLYVHRLFRVEDSSFWAVMPFVPAGSLRSIMLYSFPYGLSEPCVAVVLSQVLNALAYLRQNGEFHGDVKPGNIVVSGIVSASVRLSDFGISESVYNTETDDDDAPYWKAPENESASESDVWSVGVTALELAYGGPPLRNFDLVSESLRVKIRERFGWSSDYEERYMNVTDCHDEKTFSEDLKDMVASCLNRDPSLRPSAEDLLTHPFFANNDNGETVSDFLKRNLLEGLPSVEKRLKEVNFKISNSLRQNVEQVTIISWEFNRAKFRLDPVFQADPRRDMDKKSLLNEPTNIGTDVLDRILSTVIGTIESLDRRWQIITSTVLENGEGEGLELSGEEEIAERIEEIKSAIEVERTRRSELKAELESLRALVCDRLAKQ